MWWVIPSASPDRRHLRDVPSPATGTQGYQIHVPLPVGICNCIAHLPPVKAKPLRGGWVCVIVKRYRLRKSRDIILVKPDRSVSAWPLIKGRVAAKSSGMTGVETILSEILIESMERLCILSEKTPSNLRTSENGWREKYQSCMNSPSTLACCQNSMGLETTVWLNFYIHSALLPYPMVCKEFLTTNYSNLYDFSFNPM